MSQPQYSTPQDRAYPFPWTMPNAPKEGDRSSRAEMAVEGQPGHLVIREDLIDLWLREFRDEQTGGYSPPPMS